MSERYYIPEAAAFIIGRLKRLGCEALIPETVTKTDIRLIEKRDFDALCTAAQENGIKFYHFKKSERMLPRVKLVLGFLRGVEFDTLLDVGSGRGAFLIPFLSEFSHVKTTAIDILDRRVEMLCDMAKGGIENLSVIKGDICDTPPHLSRFDVVTLLEVLEHIPRVDDAIRSAVSLAKKYVVITVPSREDDNPEHIHLLTRERLTRIFEGLGITRLSFGGVAGHLFMIASIDGEKREI